MEVFDFDSSLAIDKNVAKKDIISDKSNHVFSILIQ